MLSIILKTNRFLLLLWIAATGLAAIVARDDARVSAPLSRSAGKRSDFLRIRGIALEPRSLFFSDYNLITSLKKRGNCLGRMCGKKSSEGSESRSSSTSQSRSQASVPSGRQSIVSSNGRRSAASTRHSDGSDAYHRAVFGTPQLVPPNTPSPSVPLSRASSSSSIQSSSDFSIAQRVSVSSGVSSTTNHGPGSSTMSMRLQGGLSRAASIGTDISTASKESLKNRFTGASFADWMPDNQGSGSPNT